MCYGLSSSSSAQLNRAKKYGLQIEIERIEKNIKNWHFSHGFNHDKLAIYTNQEPNHPTIAEWGLIPHTRKSIDSARTLQRSCLNARGETLLEKPSFVNAAKNKRCVVYVDGFFEYFHKQGKSYPYFIHGKEPIALAGLWSEWSSDRHKTIIRSFTIVTTRANDLMKGIHNNPKIKEARMPVVLSEKGVNLWIDPKSKEFTEEDVLPFLEPYPDANLYAFTVPRLIGNSGVGNSLEATTGHLYPELTDKGSQGTLF